MRTNEGYTVNGTKQFISSARIGKTTVLFAMTDPDKAKKGMSCFVVDNATPGFEIVRVEEKLGQKASDSCALAFEDMKVPFEDRIGEEGQGYAIALSSLESGRIGIAAQATGLAQAAYERALAYAKERTAFGKPIFELQAVQFRLAEMATELEASRALVLNAARMKDRGEPCLKEACMAKLFCAQAAERITSEAIQVLGGYGYLADYEVERMYRDQKVCQIYEGTNDIQKLIIARQIGRDRCRSLAQPWPPRCRRTCPPQTSAAIATMASASSTQRYCSTTATQAVASAITAPIRIIRHEV